MYLKVLRNRIQLSIPRKLIVGLLIIISSKWGFERILIQLNQALQLQAPNNINQPANFHMLKVANNPSHGHGGIRPDKIEHIPIVGLLQDTLHDVSH